MQLPAARTLIQRTIERMAALYGGMVFDEWAIVSLTNAGAQLSAYEGPRLEQYRARFVADVHALRELLAGRSLAIGEFAFAPVAEGTAYDACIRIGDTAYALFNHTALTMEQIRADARWRQAQKPFAEMAEAFRADALPT